jgi:hypothetical protein
MSDARSLLAERLRRARWTAAIRGELFSKQLEVIDDPAQFRACHPGRRAGKSESLVRFAALMGLDAGPGETVVLGAETQKKARSLHWSALRELAARHSLPFTPKGQDGAFVTPWDSRVVFWGVKDEGAVELLRGFKLRGALFDEVQTYSPRLGKLVTSVLEPALGDTGGTCTFYGTPSYTTSGPWYDICSGATPGWSVRHWTVLDNVKFPRDPASVLQQVRIRNNWDEDNATYQREWMGRFVNDTGMMVYQFVASRNTAEGLPVPVERGEATLGIDYGTTDDPCAWSVVWSANGSRDVYVLETRRHYGMLPDDAAEVTRSLVERWKPRRVVGDAGGLGAPYVAAYNRRYGHLSGEYVQRADKLGKLGQIAVVNGELQSGRLRALPAARDLIDEWQVLPWKNEKKETEDPSYANDCADATRYAFMAHFADTKPLPDAPTASELEEQARMARVRKAQQKNLSLVRR